MSSLTKAAIALMTMNHRISQMKTAASAQHLHPHRTAG